MPTSNGACSATTRSDAVRKQCIFADDALHDDREFIASEPRDLAALRVEQRCQARSDQLQQLVAGVVSERVVDLLEAIEVHQQQRQALARRLGLPDAHCQLLAQPLAVRQTRQRVVSRVVLGVSECQLARGDVAPRGPQTGQRGHR
jgi:hypothetical protein